MLLLLAACQPVATPGEGSELGTLSVGGVADVQAEVVWLDDLALRTGIVAEGTLAEGRVERRQGPVVEWWAPLGPSAVELGWDVAAPGHGPFVVTVEGEAEPDGRGLVSPGGRRWRVGEARAWDADGAELAAWITPEDDGFAVHVDEAGARWPITVDPILTTSAYTLTGSTAGSEHGAAVRRGGDVNGDGVEDMIVTAPGYSSGTGRAYVYTGSSAGLSTRATNTVQAGTAGGAFGTAVDGGNITGDGYDDVIVGEPGQNRVWYFRGSSSGISTSTGASVSGDADAVAFGSAVAVADVNGDGYDDVVVGDAAYDGDRGRFQVFHGSSSGVSGSASLTVTGASLGVELGYAVANAGDVDQDGYEDVVVGAPGVSGDGGAVYVYHGSSGGLASTATTGIGGRSGARMGTAVDGECDADGDGYPDIVVGSPDYGTGSVAVYLGSSAGIGSTASPTVSGPDGGGFGRALACTGDSDHDGFDDVIVGAPDVGTAYVFHGSRIGLASTADETLTVSGAAGLGTAVGGGVDLDDDGTVDVFAADPTYSSDQGRVYVFLGEGDQDGDGYSAGVDCDDTNAAVHPGAIEFPSDGNDADCDGMEDCYPDVDNDGYASEALGVVLSEDADCDDAGEASSAEPATDCDDSSAAIHPGATDVVSDGVDNDCDGRETCYEDADGDGYRGDSGATTESVDRDCDDRGEASSADPTGDCDEANARAYPGATEAIADGVDQSCDGRETCYVDVDGDGYRPDAVSTTASADLDCADAGEADDADLAGDCDDGDAGVNPGTAERIDDAVDQDCDGGDLCYADLDRDGYRTDDTRTSGDLDCADGGEAGAATPDGDCDDTSDTTWPGAREIVADGVDQDCDGAESCYVDADHDGYRPDGVSVVASDDGDCDDAGEASEADLAGDCDDADAATNPGATEGVADGLDANCDGREDCYVDEDGDGHRPPDGGDLRVSADLDCTDAGEADAAVPADDCDDTDALTYAGAAEVPGTGIDEDCDGVEHCFEDLDLDGYRTDVSAPSTAGLACDQPGEASAAVPAGDCDDADPAFNPGAAEIVDDGVDQDCDGGDACYTDHDGDGWRTDGSPSEDLDCDDAGEVGPEVPDGDCDDAAVDVHPGGAEAVGDGIDGDCDGFESCYPDADGDGYRPDDGTVVLSDDADCDDPGEATESMAVGDCDDAAATTNPRAEEIIGDEIDSDCNGWERCYTDLDADGYRSEDPERSDDTDCSDTGEASAALPSGDCDETNGGVNPGATEVCDGLDDDCDGSTDGADAVGATPWEADTDGDGFTDRDDVVVACSPPDGYQTPSTFEDCDDADPDVHPDAPEAEDGVDNDCDGAVDDLVGDTGETEGTPEHKGCACGTGGEASAWGLLALGALVLRRRR